MTFRGHIGAYGAAGDSCLDPAPDRAGIVQRASHRGASGRVAAPMPRMLGRLLMALFLAGLVPGVVTAQSHPPPPHASAPAPHASSTPHSSGSHPANNQQHPPGKQHLSEWMQKNQGLTPDEQVKKLQQEKGFNRLTPQQQESATNHLRQLNQMPPEQRQRELERVENIEHLSPPQQQQLRASAHSLGQMAPERQQAVKDAMRSLRNVPPGLRQSELNSKYGSQLSPEERGVAGSLLSVEPYHPPPPPPR